MNIAGGDQWDDSELIKAYDKAVKGWRKPEPSEEQVKMDVNDSANANPGGIGPWVSVSSASVKKEDKEASNMVNVGSWVLGSPCRSVWTLDGLEYEAKIVGMEGPKCIIRFVGYGNQETKELAELRETFGKRSRDRQRREAQVSHTNNSQYLTPSGLCRNDGEDYFSSVSLSSSMCNNCPSIINGERDLRDEDQMTATTDASGIADQPVESVSSSAGSRVVKKKDTPGKRKRDDEVDSMCVEVDQDEQDASTLDIDRREDILPSAAEATVGSSSSSSISNGNDENQDGDDEATSAGPFREELKGFPSMIPQFPVPPMPMSLANAKGKFDFGRGQLPSLLLSWYMSGYHAGYFDANSEKNKTSREPEDPKPRSKR